MLHLVGIGLCDWQDITLRGLETVRRARHVYLEGYTSLLQCSHDELEHHLGCPITLLNRTGVEQQVGPILECARDEEVVLLVVGDPFAATTHADLLLRAREKSIAVRVVHNASVLTAVGEIGLDLYRFGRTVSIPFWERGYEPTSFVKGLRENGGLHTLCLLDIKAERSRFMMIPEGLGLLREACVREGLPLPERIVGVARLGCQDMIVRVGSPDELLREEFGGPPHCLIVPGRLHPIEKEMLLLINDK